MTVSAVDEFRPLADRAITEDWRLSLVLAMLERIPPADQVTARLAMFEAIRDELERRRTQPRTD